MSNIGTAPLENRIMEIERALRGIYVDCNQARADIRNYGRNIVPLLNEARAIDSQLGAYGYPPIVSLPDFEYIKYLSSIFPENQNMYPQQQQYPMQSVGGGYMQPQVRAPQPQVTLPTLGGGYAMGGTSSPVDSTDRFDKYAQARQNVINPTAAAIPDPFDGFGNTTTTPVAAPKAETKPVYKPFDGSEYPLMLASGLTAVLDKDIGNYIKYDVVGKSKIEGRMSDDIYTIKNFTISSTDRTSSLQCMCATECPKTLVTTVPNIKRFYVDKGYVDISDILKLIDYANDQTVYDIDTLSTMMHMLYEIRATAFATLGSWVEDKLVIKFINHMLFSAVLKNNMTINSDFVSVTDNLEVLKTRLIDNTKIKPAITAHNAETFGILAKYVFNLIGNMTVEEEEDYLYLELSEPLTFIGITDDYLASDITSIEKGQAWLVRADSYPELFKLLDIVYNLSDIFKATRTATIYTLDEKQNDVRYTVYKDINGNFVIVK